MAEDSEGRDGLSLRGESPSPGNADDPSHFVLPFAYSLATTPRELLIFMICRHIFHFLIKLVSHCFVIKLCFQRFDMYLDKLNFMVIASVSTVLCTVMCSII